MKNILKFMSLIFLTTAMFSSCEKDETTFNSLNPEGTIVYAFPPSPGFFDLGDLDNANNSIELGTSGEAANSLTIYKSYNGGARVEHATITDLPSTINVSIDDALDGLGITRGDLVLGDKFDFTLELDSDKYNSVKNITIAVSCFSELEGTHTYTTSTTFCDITDPPLTGTVEWTQVTAGVYESSDFALGSYQLCYGAAAASWGTLQFTDECNTITMIGEDNYGDTWTFNITEVNGPDLHFTWDNTYGEAGTVVLTRAGGADWPPLSN